MIEHTLKQPSFNIDDSVYEAYYEDSPTILRYSTVPLQKHTQDSFTGVYGLDIRTTREYVKMLSKVLKTWEIKISPEFDYTSTGVFSDDTFTLQTRNTSDTKWKTERQNAMFVSLFLLGHVVSSDNLVFDLPELYSIHYTQQNHEVHVGAFRYNAYLQAYYINNQHRASIIFLPTYYMTQINWEVDRFYTFVLPNITIITNMLTVEYPGTEVLTQVDSWYNDVETYVFPFIKELNLIKK